MKRSLLILSSLVLTSIIPALADHHEGWESLFDGKTLAGWKSNDEKPNVFTVVEGAIQVKGGRAHLFYDGDVNGGKFKDFEIKMKVKTTAGANGGFYFHTEFEEKGWPSKGYECQINTSHSDDRKTGSLYGIQDVLKNAPSHDDEWFDYQITVKGKNIKIAINGKEVVNYTEPENPERPNSFKGRLLGEGTFGIQGHDPKSVTFLKDIKVKVLK
ncbi:DUF1080 domain-containing protein [bacterium]|jgi:hypothetical protein|nr:DUF1080 domain-containing protein [Verrucomicrobiales bacterium]MDC3255321.1 DUF1080 domain-containing protein [bacterium]